MFLGSLIKINSLRLHKFDIVFQQARAKNFKIKRQSRKAELFPVFFISEIRLDLKTSRDTRTFSIKIYQITKKFIRI